MSERQAKRLRRAQRAYIAANRTSLARGAPVHEAAAARANVVRTLWPRLDHRLRGAVAVKLTGRVTYRGGHRHTPQSLNGALRVLGVHAP